MHQWHKSAAARGKSLLTAAWRKSWRQPAGLSHQYHRGKRSGGKQAAMAHRISSEAYQSSI